MRRLLIGRRTAAARYEMSRRTLSLRHAAHIWGQIVPADTFILPQTTILTLIYSCTGLPRLSSPRAGLRDGADDGISRGHGRRTHKQAGTAAGDAATPRHL